jgi:hypothetical protein
MSTTAFLPRRAAPLVSSFSVALLIAVLLYLFVGPAIMVGLDMWRDAGRPRGILGAAGYIAWAVLSFIVGK